MPQLRVAKTFVFIRSHAFVSRIPFRVIFLLSVVHEPISNMVNHVALMSDRNRIMMMFTFLSRHRSACINRFHVSFYLILRTASFFNSFVMPWCWLCWRTLSHFLHSFRCRAVQHISPHFNSCSFSIFGGSERAAAPKRQPRTPIIINRCF